MLYGRFEEVPACMRTPPDITETYSFYPFLWTEEGRAEQTDIRIVSADEALKLHLELAGYSAE